MDSYQQTPRTQLKRLPKRGSYDRATVHAILDEAFLCHVGFVHEGAPVVIPTAYGREGETVYLHGSAGSRMLRSLAGGNDICVEVTIIDGLVMARSAFHHSINYRSVVLFGKARPVTEADEKMRALRCITEHIARGRWDETREPNQKELAATSVVAIPLEEVSAKARTGMPIDDEEDYALPVWAGVLPVELTAREAVTDERVSVGIPASVAQWRRR